MAGFEVITEGELQTEHPVSDGSLLKPEEFMTDAAYGQGCGSFCGLRRGKYRQRIRRISNSQACSEVLGTAVVLSRPTMFSRIVQA
jgi:hypothetical protein